jgi:hypothetical protein
VLDNKGGCSFRLVFVQAATAATQQAKTKSPVTGTSDFEFLKGCTEQLYSSSQREHFVYISTVCIQLVNNALVAKK